MPLASRSPGDQMAKSFQRFTLHVQLQHIEPPIWRRIEVEGTESLRKIIKTRGHFPTDEAAAKLIWLALRNITADWGRAAHDWKTAMNQFAILYEDRFVRPSV
ncbi:hypothetical protein CFB39_37515 [Burkholderia sp. AU6039]|nr:hypothetical protein CFB39_37515 [Burkholderia sp. AU6039]